MNDAVLEVYRDVVNYADHLEKLILRSAMISEEALRDMRKQYIPPAIDKKLIDDRGKISDGYHTFDELYYHRMMLFAVICRQNRNRAWKSWRHDDGSMHKDYFIVGINTKEGAYTYHYHKDHWDLFKVQELRHAPKWDGHKPEDVTRLLTVVEENKN